MPIDTYNPSWFNVGNALRANTKNWQNATQAQKDKVYTNRFGQIGTKEADEDYNAWQSSNKGANYWDPTSWGQDTSKTGIDGYNQFQQRFGDPGTASGQRNMARYQSLQNTGKGGFSNIWGGDDWDAPSYQAQKPMESYFTQGTYAPPERTQAEIDAEKAQVDAAVKAREAASRPGAGPVTPEWAGKGSVGIGGYGNPAFAEGANDLTDDRNVPRLTGEAAASAETERLATPLDTSPYKGEDVKKKELNDFVGGLGGVNFASTPLTEYQKGVMGNLLKQYPEGKMPDGTPITEEWIREKYGDAPVLKHNVSLGESGRAIGAALTPGNYAKAGAAALGASPETQNTVGVLADPASSLVQSAGQVATDLTGSNAAGTIVSGGTNNAPNTNNETGQVDYAGPTSPGGASGQADRSTGSPYDTSVKEGGKDAAAAGQDGSGAPGSAGTNAQAPTTEGAGNKIDDSAAVKDIKAGLEKADTAAQWMNTQYANELGNTLANKAFAPDQEARDFLMGKGTAYEGSTAADFYGKKALEDLQGKSYSAKYFEGEGPGSLRDVYARDAARQQEAAARRLSAMGKGRSGALVRGAREIDARSADQLQLAMADAAKNADAAEATRTGAIKSMAGQVDTSRSFLGQNLADQSGKDRDAMTKALSLRAGQGGVMSQNAQSMRDVYAESPKQLNEARKDAIEIAAGVPRSITGLMAQLEATTSADETAAASSEFEAMARGSARQQAFHNNLMRMAGNNITTAAALYLASKKKNGNMEYGPDGWPNPQAASGAAGSASGRAAGPEK